MSTDLEELETAIEAIDGLTAHLQRLRRVRAHYVRTFGARAARAEFVELDRSLRALRKAAR